MSTTAASLDLASVFMYLRSLESRMTDHALAEAQRLADAQGGNLTIDELRDCLSRSLECAKEASGSECTQPDYAVLMASQDDIQAGRCRDIQDVIDELQGRAD